jgi:hypothetical protein
MSTKDERYKKRVCGETETGISQKRSVSLIVSTNIHSKYIDYKRFPRLITESTNYRVKIN